LFESFDIADTPCQSTHRVARSATGFQAAVNISTVHNRERVAVVFAQSLFHFWVVQVKTKAAVSAIRVRITGTRAAVVD